MTSQDRIIIWGGRNAQYNCIILAASHDRASLGEPPIRRARYCSGVLSGKISDVTIYAGGAGLKVRLAKVASCPFKRKV